MTNKKIVLSLIIIGFISLGLKLYTVDFSIPVNSDNLGYTLDAIAYSNGDVFIPTKKNPGWPLFISPFLFFIDSDKFIDYSNIVRSLSIGISTITILPFYVLTRQFFDEKYSIVAVSLFAFEPHLNFHAGLGLSEPLFILVMIIAFFLILNGKNKSLFVAFALSGIFWWIRLEGITLIIAFSIIFFLLYKKFSNYIPKYVICIIIFVIVCTPNLILRESQFGDPFYIWWGQSITAENYGILLANSSSQSVSEYLQHENVGIFYKNFLVGFFAIFENLGRILFPYLIILVPFGIIFSFRPIDQNKKFIMANWIIVLVTIAVLSIVFSVIPHRRFLFQLYPLLIIFAVMPIQRVVEYGLNAFSFSRKKKNVFLLIVIILALILGGLFTTLRIGPHDIIYEVEQINYARFLVDTLDGRILDGGNALEYLGYSNIVDSKGLFDKNIKRKYLKDPYPDTYKPGSVVPINVYGNDISELILNGEKVGLKYIAINERGSYFFLPYLNDIYLHDENYPYLKKIYDSSEHEFRKFKVKVFEIDYEKFHQN